MYDKEALLKTSIEYNDILCEVCGSKMRQDNDPFAKDGDHVIYFCNNCGRRYIYHRTEE